MIIGNYVLVDIECYPNYFELGIKDYVSKETQHYEISKFLDHRKEMYRFLTEYKGYMVTFNGVFYDNVVLAYFVKEYKRFINLSPLELCAKLKEFSNSVIEDDHEKTKWYKWYKHPWINIDLFLYWAKSLRISKKISLKSLGIQLNHTRVQELPYPHNSLLTRQQMEHVLDYNLSNDLVILDSLTDRMKEEIKLRKYIYEEYGIQCWSMDAPKICSEYMLEVFCKKTYNNQYPTYEEYKREVKNSRYIPKPNWKLGEFLPHVQFKTKFFQNLYEEIKASGSEFSKEFLYQNRNTKVHVSMGIGGIHIINDNEFYESTKAHKIIDQDVTSLYPTLLENYRFIRKELEIVLDEYLQLKLDRVEAKRLGIKIKDTFLKLMLNGFTGIVDQDVSWLYSPEQMTALRVFGQLIQLRILEELSEIGIQVISNNTDGTTSIVPIDKIDAYHRISQEVSNEFKIGWEFTNINKIVYTNVNNYIAFPASTYMLDGLCNMVSVKEDTKPKRKGLYKYGKDIPLGDSVNEQVIPRAIELFWKDGIPLKESISNPEKYGFHIYDYCRSNRISKDFEVFYNYKRVQNLNRYYFQTKGNYLLKRKRNQVLYSEADRLQLEQELQSKKGDHGMGYAPDFKPYTQEELDKLVDDIIFKGGKFQHINVGEGVCLFNDYVEKTFEEYDVNYTHYIEKAYTIVTEILNRQLTLF